jgi:hypothetical protein
LLFCGAVTPSLFLILRYSSKTRFANSSGFILVPTRLACSKYLYDPSFKFLTRSEGHNTSSGYGYFLASFWISTRSTGFIAKFEFAKTGNF